jgi:hypothetical protein
MLTFDINPIIAAANPNNSVSLYTIGPPMKDSVLLTFPGTPFEKNFHTLNILHTTSANKTPAALRLNSNTTNTHLDQIANDSTNGPCAKPIPTEVPHPSPITHATISLLIDVSHLTLDLHYLRKLADKDSPGRKIISTTGTTPFFPALHLITIISPNISLNPSYTQMERLQPSSSIAATNRTIESILFDLGHGPPGQIHAKTTHPEIL